MVSTVADSCVQADQPATIPPIHAGKLCHSHLLSPSRRIVGINTRAYWREAAAKELQLAIGESDVRGAPLRSSL